MKACPACGHLNEDGNDFCESCGEYLRWEATGVQESVEAPPPASPPEPADGGRRRASGSAPSGTPVQPPAPTPPAPAPEEPEPVLITMRAPEDDGYASGTPRVQVDPGGRVVLMALVRNQSGIVDNYDLRVDGLAEGWWTITPQTVYLVPYGAGGGSYEQEVEIHLHPPRAPEAEARVWELSVVATSRASEGDVATAPAEVEIGPYQELVSAVAPERRKGRVEARYDLTVTNKANAEVTVEPTGVDAEESLTFEFREPPGPKRARKRRGVRDLADDAAREAQAAALRPAAAAGAPADAAKRAAMKARSGATQRVLAWIRRRKPLGREVSRVRLGPGEEAKLVLSVQPPKQIWIGRSTLHPFQVTVQPVGVDAPQPPSAATFVQRQWLPWWLLILVPIIIALVVWFLLTRPANATVPDLTDSADVFAAESTLKEAGLSLGDKFEEPDPDAEPGSIVEQTPAAGEEVEEGAAVSIKVALGDTKFAVPDVTGQTLDEAGQTLDQAGFQLGRSLTEPSDPATSTVTSQIPVPDTLEEEGSSIDLVFEPPPEDEAAADAQGEPEPAAGAVVPGAPVPAVPAAGSPGQEPNAQPGAPGTVTVPTEPTTEPEPAPEPEAPAGAGTPAQQTVTVPPPAEASGEVEMPDVVGDASQAGVDEVAAAGLVASVQLEYDATVPAGQIVSQAPPAGTPVAAGATVAVVVSAGIPDLFFERDGDIVQVRGATGEEIGLLAESEDVEGQPSVSRAGDLIAFRSGREGSTPGLAPTGQIVTVAPGDPRSRRPLTNAGFDDRRPAISPDGSVVAFVSNRGSRPDDYDLCLVRTDGSQPNPNCIGDRDVNVSRPAWSPDGRSIVVTASDDTQTELLLYTSATPNSPRAADWVDQGLVTDAMHGDRRRDQVLSSAFSPDGTRLAFSANWKDGAFKLFTLAVNADGTFAEEAEPSPLIPACELAWRPDGRTLAVAQRDSDCDERGRITVVDPAAPGAQTLLTAVGTNSGNPAWSPFASDE